MLNRSSVRNLVKFYIPHLITAGNYALAIQKDIVVHENKGSNYSELGQFLTDADLSVENFLEVATLSSGFNVNFEGEEAEKSLNIKYFQMKENPEFKVWVDPINGTFLYKDGRDNFDIIVTIVNNKTREIIAVIDYMPSSYTFYIGIKGLGAFSFCCILGADVNIIDGPANYRMPLDSEKPIGLYKIKEPFTKRIKTINSCFQMEVDKIPICDILTGKISAYVKPKGKLIDWGAIAFIIEQAGGIVTDFQGKPIPNYLDFHEQRIPSLLVSSSSKLHNEILKQMEGYPED